MQVIKLNVQKIPRFSNRISDLIGSQFQSTLIGWEFWSTRISSKSRITYRAQADYILVPGFTSTEFCVFLTLECDVWALWSFRSLLPASGIIPNDFLIDSKTISRVNSTFSRDSMADFKINSPKIFENSKKMNFGIYFEMNPVRFRETLFDPTREWSIVSVRLETSDVSVERDSILEFVRWLFVVGLLPNRSELWFDNWFLNDWKFWASKIKF